MASKRGIKFFDEDTTNWTGEHHTIGKDIEDKKPIYHLEFFSRKFDASLKEAKLTNLKNILCLDSKFTLNRRN